MEVNTLNELDILATDNSPERNEDVAYMAAQTGRQNFHHFCRDVVAIYGDMYLSRWSTGQKPEEMEKGYKRRGYPGCIGCIECTKLF